MKKWERFEMSVDKIMEEEQIPGIAVALSQNGTIIYERGFGTENLETKEPITPDTIFGIASITKTFTALAIMKLAEERKLKPDDAITKHLPNFALRHDNIETIKIHHLLSHTTGLPAVERKEDIENFKEHIDYLNEVKWNWVGVPGAYFNYNNDTFLLLGAIIEKITGENYKEYIKRTIFTPMNMNRSTFELGELEQLTNVTTPYIIDNEKPNEYIRTKLGNYAVGGGIFSTVRDLAKYGNIYVGMNNKLAKKMMKPVQRTNGKSTYGYGFQITPDYEDVTLVEHGGGHPGVSSNFGFIPEKGIVAIVLTNISQASADKIWLGAVNTALGIPLNRSRFIQPHFEIKKERLASFVGIYKTGDGSQVSITFKDDSLQANIDGITHGIRAGNSETLVITEIEKPMRFFFNENNETWALFLGLRMFIKSN